MAEQEHGTRGRYRVGCRCDPCRRAENDYRKGLRQRNAGARLQAVPQSVPVMPLASSEPPVASEAQVGAVESVSAAVQREIALLAGAAEKPGMVATALAMAKILDSPVAVAQHPAAAARLVELMAILGKGGRRKRGKLAAVREMTAG